MQERMQSILEEQKKRTLEVVRAAERSRAQMLCEKAAAEHDLVQVRVPHTQAARQLHQRHITKLKGLLSGPPYRLENANNVHFAQAKRLN